MKKVGNHNSISRKLVLGLSLSLIFSLSSFAQEAPAADAAAATTDVAAAPSGGDAVKGKALFASQGCLACHTIEKGQPMKGPYMGQIGSIMSRDQIVESILKPNASISQGFATVLLDTKDGKSFTGFVTAESAEKLTIRDIGGNATTLEKSAIKSRKQLDTSMMPAGLANSLSFEELASLVSYLQQQK